jgi:hypothetical protein
MFCDADTDTDVTEQVGAILLHALDRHCLA